CGVSGIVSVRAARRLEVLLTRERELWGSGLERVAGVDEAGVGPLAGPVVAAAVIFPTERFIFKLNDSKRLAREDREAVYQAIIDSGLHVGVGVADVDEINRLNILWATRLAWRRALEALPARPALVLIDGNLRAPLFIPQKTLVGGDARCASIAAASVIAKVTRDRLMVELDRRHPEYGFARHKGYATADHLQALRRWGPCPSHRQTFLPADVVQVALFPS
ncbi:MAG: ribonuclease HII, partial [Pseudomonadota bacterium]